MVAWIIALSAVVAAAAIVAAAWQAIAVMLGLKAWMKAAGDSTLEQLDELVSDTRLALLPVRQTAEEARRQLMLMGPVLESALKLHIAADHAQSAARKFAQTAADTAEAAAARVEHAAGKYRSQIDQAIGIAEAALEGWMFLRSRQAKSGYPACSERKKGNLNEEGSD